MFEKEDVIYSYTRKNAIEDGILIDVTEDARDSGIKFSIAVTVKLWNHYIKPSNEMESIGQSKDGRLWDLLVMFIHAANRSNGQSTIRYKVLFQMVENEEPDLVEIKALCHPGDTMEPVITLMLPDED